MHRNLKSMMVACAAAAMSVTVGPSVGAQAGNGGSTGSAGSSQPDGSQQ